MRRPDRDLQRRHDRQGAEMPARPAPRVLPQRHLPRQRDATRRRHDQAARLRVLVPQPHRLRLRQPVRRDGDAPRLRRPAPLRDRGANVHRRRSRLTDRLLPRQHRVRQRAGTSCRAGRTGGGDASGTDAVRLHVRDGGAAAGTRADPTDPLPAVRTSAFPQVPGGVAYRVPAPTELPGQAVAVSV